MKGCQCGTCSATPPRVRELSRPFNYLWKGTVEDGSTAYAAPFSAAFGSVASSSRCMARVRRGRVRSRRSCAILCEQLAAFPQLTGRRLRLELRELGYAGGYSILTDFLRDIRPNEPAPFEDASRRHLAARLLAPSSAIRAGVG